MKKIGFIDYHIDEWHANNYPKWIRESSRSNDFEIAYAWEESPAKGLRSLSKWCKDFDVTPAKSITQLVEDCDGIIILAPSNPEVHERIADIPLKSGKPVYIDKPFAPDKSTAEKIFAKAEKYKTPLFSSSALRFGTEIEELKKKILKDGNIDFAYSTGGGGSFAEYSIHQIEMLVMLMGTGAKRVMQCGSKNTNQLLIDYGFGRKGTMQFHPMNKFQISVTGNNNNITVSSMTDFFPGLIEAILTFFDTKHPPVKKEETIEIVSIMEHGIKALEKHDSWIDLNNY